MRHNYKYFSKVKKPEVCKDKIHLEIIDNLTRDNMLNGKLHEEDCENKKGFEF